MLRLARPATVTLAALLLTGCLPLSLVPLYSGPDDLVFDEALLGTWAPQAEGDDDVDVWGTWLIERVEDDALRYRIHITNTDDDKATTAIFVGHVVKLGDRLFLDLFPINHEPELTMSPWMSMHLAQCHSFIPITIDGKDGFTLRPVDLDNLKEKLAAHPEAIAHRFVQDEDGDDTALVFTADTRALQAFVREHVVGDLLSDPQPFRRAQPKPVTQ